ncbi:ammonium transporter [Novosphingobium lindaniclasticum]
MTRRGLLPIFAALTALPGSAMAQAGRIDVADSGDTAWMLAASALVLLMAIPGLALLHSGSVRARNALSVLIQSGAIVAVVTLLWAVVGYTLAFGDLSGGWIGGGNAWMLIDLGNVRSGTQLPESVFVLFQIAVAALPPVLMAGAWAERARFGWVVAFCALWTLVVQAPIAHWIWGGGWLSRTVGTLDWAGGLAMFTSAGVSALVVAVMMGRRIGFPRETGRAHNSVMALAGTAFLWAGAFGLCGGWALSANDDAAAAVIAAHLAIAAAVLTWLGIERLATGRVSAAASGKGVLAGIAVIAPAAGYISPGAAILFGIVGAAVGYQAQRFVRRALQIDDAMDVFAVAGLSGMAGALLLAPFLSEDLGGVGYYPGNTMISQLIAQVSGLGIVVVWSVAATAIVALMASLAFPMRVSEDAERAGLDRSNHGHGEDVS